MTSLTAAASVGVSPTLTSPTAPLPIRLQPIPPELLPANAPDGSEGAGAAVGAGAGTAAGDGVVDAGLGVVLGVVDPDPELAAPPVEGTVTGAVGAGVGAGRSAGTVADGPKAGTVTGDETTGMGESVNDGAPVSETSSARTPVGADVAAGVTTASATRAVPEDAPVAYDVGWTLDALVSFEHTELPTGGAAAGAGPVADGGPPADGAGGDPTGTGEVSAGVAISPDQSEAE